MKKIFLIILLLGFGACLKGFAQKNCDGLMAELCIDTLQAEFGKTICEWIGTPYNYSGDTKDGIDCSGFVAMFYKRVYNVSLGDCSRDIYKTDVKPLLKKKLMPSDLVFFKIGKRGISHVGIYLGQNKFIHASTKLGVIISDLNEPYYKKYFYKGGRVKEVANRN